jgi:hypothetical protein
VDFIGPFVIECRVLETNLMAKLQVFDIKFVSQGNSVIDQGADQIATCAGIARKKKSCGIQIRQRDEKPTKDFALNKDQRQTSLGTFFLINKKTNDGPMTQPPCDRLPPRDRGMQLREIPAIGSQFFNRITTILKGFNFHLFYLNLFLHSTVLWLRASSVNAGSVSLQAIGPPEI